MFCQYCGKKIDEFADVCIGCGKLLKQEKKSNTQSKLFMALSIIVLIFSSIFFVIGVISCFAGMYDLFDVYVWERLDISVSVNTDFFISIIVSLISEACAAMLSLILLVFNNKKAINIISFGLSLGLLMIAGVMAFLYFAWIKKRVII